MSTKNVLLSYHNDCPFQATISGSRIHPREMLGIVIPEEREDTSTNLERYIQQSHEYKHNPLRLAITSDWFYGFLVVLKKAGCLQEVLWHISRVRTRLRSVEMREKEEKAKERSDLRHQYRKKNSISHFKILDHESDEELAMRNFFPPHILEALNKAAKEYLMPYGAFYEAEDYHSGFISLAAATRIPIYDAKTGDLYHHNPAS